jgi:hypothetical protein
LPAFTDIYRQIDYDYPGLKSKEVTRAYQSSAEPPLTKAQLTGILEDNNILFPDNEVV